jgi:Aspartyl protease/PDZ domain
MNVYRFVACMAALFACLGPAALEAAPTDDQTPALLAASRAALGGSAIENVSGLEVTSKISFGGLTGTDVSWQAIGRPLSAENYNTPPISGGDGYDGTDVWSLDGSGLVSVDGGDAGRSATISGDFMSSYALWTANNGGATVRSAGVQTAGSNQYDVLEVTAPNSLVPFQLWLDRTTHLPWRSVQTIGPTVSTSTYSDYRPVNGLQIPYSVESATSDGNSTSVTVTAVVANPPDLDAHLKKPASNVHDFSIVGGGTQTSVPFDLIDNHVYLSLLLNGRGPYRFILDTGGANYVDPAVAREIGAAGHGSVQGGGVGNTTESLAFANVDSMQIGTAKITNQLFAVAPTRQGFGIAGGQRVDGLIGFEVLSRFVTTFDYAGNTVIFQMPDAATVPAGANVVPFVLDGRQPQFPCTIDSIAAQCTLDTGSRSSISLMTPWIAAHPQVVPSKISGIGVNGFGVGGGAMGRLGRIKTLGFGNFILSNVITDFSAVQKGAFAAPFVAGNVGGGVFKRFSLTLDYEKQTMALTSNNAFMTPDDYERAGLFLINRNGTAVVYDVRPQTAAASAGFVKGDTIDSIGGKPAAGMSLQAVRELFFQPAGTQIQIGVTHKGGTHATLTLTLQDFV